MALKDALNLLREMERKYVRVIEQMKGDSLVLPPSARTLQKLEADLERARERIRELEAKAPKKDRTSRRAPR